MMSSCSNPACKLGDLPETSADVFRGDSRCLAVLLFGSAARHEESDNSDLDLLVLYRGEVPEEGLDALDERVSVSFYDEDRWQRLCQRSPLFAIHLAQEGRPLHDPHHLLEETLGTVRPLRDDAHNRLTAITKRRLHGVLTDPCFHPGDPISAGEIYALAKQAAFLVSARQHGYVFNRHSAFDRLAETVPGLRTDLSRVALLEAAWLASRPNCEHAWEETKGCSAEAVRSGVQVIDKALA